MRLALLLLLAAPCAAQTADSLTARLDRIVDAAHAAGAFDGVVLVGRGDRVVYERGVGLADRSWGVPNTPATRFPWASVTKQLTATVVLQLVSEGRLSLDTPLGDVLPGLRADAAGRVRIRHLLTNASGLPDPDAIAGFYVAADSTRDALVDAALRDDLAFEPGATFRYNNLDFIALGRAVEALTGQPFPDVLRERVLASSSRTVPVMPAGASTRSRRTSGKGCPVSASTARPRAMKSRLL